jgi:hypothetical protein
MNITILINGTSAKVSPPTSYTADVCTAYSPMLTARSFLVSAAICAGAALLIFLIHCLVIYCCRKYQSLQDHYYQEFYRFMMDLKALIDLGNRTKDIYIGTVSDFDTKAHIIYMFQHIDKIDVNREFPLLKSLEGE